MTSEILKLEVRDRAVRELIPEDTTIEQLATGFVFTEGPVWCGDYFLFSDIPMDRIIRLRFTRQGPEVSTFRQPSGNSNGLTLDKSNRLIACEHGTRRVTRTEPDGSIKVLADNYRGQRLNSPNDVVVKSDGGIYFTDPPYGLREHLELRETECNGVYRISPGGELTLLVDDCDRPNGLAFSPDESLLYINDTVRRHIRVFNVAADSTLTDGKVFIDMRGDEPGVPDGMKVDRHGNVYCTGPGGFWIISPAGQLLARVMPPELPANLAWGDRDWQSLYLAAHTSVYRIRTNTQGIPVGNRGGM
jgi:gluconolactonase